MGLQLAAFDLTYVKI